MSLKLLTIPKAEILLARERKFYLFGKQLVNPKSPIQNPKSSETLYWLELLLEAEIFPEHKLAALMKETNEIVAMIVSSIKTIRSNRNGKTPQSKIQNPKSKIQT